MQGQFFLQDMVWNSSGVFQDIPERPLVPYLLPILLEELNSGVCYHLLQPGPPTRERFWPAGGSGKG